MRGAAFAVLCGALVGCSEEPAVDLHGAGASGAGGAMLCVPGEQVACACPGGEQGAQACLADGSGYGPCGCPDAGGSGAGGAGGSAGSGATSGASGAGGGVAGAGGAAGASGGASGSPGGGGGSGGSAGSEPADAGPLSCDKAACDQLHGEAHWICKGGVCEGCGTQSYADCDGNPANSCETYIGASPHCGQCGKVCAPGYYCTSCGGSGCFYCFKP